MNLTPSNMLLRRAAEHRVMPWRNGGGFTTELWIAPPGAALDAFDWRLSMARIEAPGPFSAFAGIDRVLAVLEGRLSLRIAGRREIELGPGDSPIAFAGELEVEGTPLGAAVLDLNLMVRRDRFIGSLTRLQIRQARCLPANEGACALLARSDGVSWEPTITGAHGGRLDCNDLLWLEHASSALRLVPPAGGSAELYRVDVRPR